MLFEHKCVFESLSWHYNSTGLTSLPVEWFARILTDTLNYFFGWTFLPQGVLFHWTVSSCWLKKDNSKKRINLNLQGFLYLKVISRFSVNASRTLWHFNMQLFSTQNQSVLIIHKFDYTNNYMYMLANFMNTWKLMLITIRIWWMNPNWRGTTNTDGLRRHGKDWNTKKSFSISLRNTHQTRAVDVNHVASKGTVHFDNQIKTLFFVSFSWCFLWEIENNFLAFLSSNTEKIVEAWENSKKLLNTSLSSFFFSAGFLIVPL